MLSTTVNSVYKLCFCLIIGQSLASFVSSVEPLESDLSDTILVDGFNSHPLSVLLLNGLFAGHLFPLVSLGEELVKRGHNVTLCSTVMEGSKLLPDLPESVGIKFLSAGYDDITQEAFNEFTRGQKDVRNSLAATSFVAIAQISAVKVLDTLDSAGIEDFDIIICDFSVIYLGVYYSVLGKPVIAFSSMLPPYPAIESPWPIPFTLSGGQSENLSFLDRLQNAILLPMLIPLWNLLFASICKADERLVRTVSGVNFMRYPGIYIPHLITTVVGFDIPTLRTPLRHYVGPVLKNKYDEQSNSHLKKWLSGKDDRTVVYISMGTTGYVTKNTAQAIVDGVMATEYNAVWALRDDNRNVIEGIEINENRIQIHGWIQQQAVLKHRAVILTILHCGLNSVQESLYNGLPVICLPHAFDHYATGGTIRNIGVGISLYSFMDSVTGNINVTAAHITNAIQTVTTGTFIANANKLSLLYKFAGGAKTASDLVEFYADVGYDHLIPAFAKYNWTWVQYYNADVNTVLIGLLVSLLLSVYMCIRYCCHFGAKDKPHTVNCKTD